jgi:hypothetical protein
MSWLRPIVVELTCVITARATAGVCFFGSDLRAAEFARVRTSAVPRFCHFVVRAVLAGDAFPSSIEPQLTHRQDNGGRHDVSRVEGSGWNGR